MLRLLKGTVSRDFSPVSLTPVANLPSVSTTQGELVAIFAASVVDTGGNLPPVSLTPVVHLDLRSLQIFEKIRNDPNVIIRGLGKDDS